MTISREALAALTSIELREAELLAWGGTAAQWTEQEIIDLIMRHGEGRSLVEELVTAALLVRTPQGGYRTRAHETVRLLATLRQSFPSRPVTDGRSLVLDYRFLHRPRRHPRRADVDRSTLLGQLDGLVGPAGSSLAATIMPSAVSGFQARATESILQSLATGSPGGVMVTAGTGSGKTLAFYLPVLTRIADLNTADPTGAAKALAVYPRNELLKDQLRTLLGYTTGAWAAGVGPRPITVGTWFGSTPDDIRYFNPSKSKEWRATRVKGRFGFICPFLTCFQPNCSGDMVWTQADLDNGIERLICSACDSSVDERFIRLTRRGAVESEPDILLTTTESLNRQLASPRNLKAFGVSQRSLQIVLLDELHLYEGIAGAQSAYVFRRLSQALGRHPAWVALSATLQRADEFLAQSVGLPVERVTVVSPKAHELEESGAEYLLALRHDPTSGTGTLSTTIQASMALTRCLDVLSPDPFSPSPSSEGVSGSKVFAFTDKLDVTNRLFWDLMNAEGWAWEGKALSNRSVLSLAHLRSETQERVRPENREPATERDPDGQWWWLPERLGHGLDVDRQLVIGRTSSQDRGVSEDAEVVIATSTLEVGFDDARVGAVMQHKSPHDAASFLQRKGRAGRDPSTRPWTLVVLSDWGRDQAAWNAYDALFSPELPARSLPLDNRYVQRIQSVYVLLDWLSREISVYSHRGSIWSDLAAPANVLAEDHGRQKMIRQRQNDVRAVLEALLSPGPTRNRLRRHLQAALGLPKGPRGDVIVDSLLWDGPRPLLLAVVPTMIRRLRDDWLAERPSVTDPAVQHRIPLRDFAPGNLFGDLSATDVLFEGPGLDEFADAPYLPVLRTIRDFMPGTVSRHFGVRASSKRHWVKAPYVSEGAVAVDAEATYGGILQGSVTVDGIEVPLVTPTRIELSPVPPEVKDHSRVDPTWGVSLTPVGTGLEVPFPDAIRKVFLRVVSHIHTRGDGVRNVRYALRATGTVFMPVQSYVAFTFCNTVGIPVALGAEMVVDGFAVHVNVPQPDYPPEAAEKADWLRWSLLHDESIPHEINRFARETLAEASQVVWARLDLAERAWQSFSDGELASELKEAAFLLGRLRRRTESQDRNLTSDENSEDGSTDEISLVDAEWLESPDVTSRVRAALNEVQDSVRSSRWTSWWRRRYTLTAASALLQAMSSLAHGLDEEALILDLDPNDDTLAWITETGPGGIGAIESCLRAVLESPELLTYSLAGALTPTDLETMDSEMVDFVSTEDDKIRSIGANIIMAWRQGHEAAKQALEQLYKALSDIGVSLHSASRTAISTRLLGPGSHANLVDCVGEWLTVRERLSAAGIQTNSRVLAAVVGRKAERDDVLRLPSNTDPQRRVRAIANVLWPWGSDAAPQAPDNLYADLPAITPGALVAHVDFSPPVLTVLDWNSDTRVRVHTALAQRGEVRLRFDQSNLAVGRAALLDLQTIPVELDTLLVYPSVVATMIIGSSREAWLRLWESTR